MPAGCPQAAHSLVGEETSDQARGGKGGEGGGSRARGGRWNGRVGAPPPRPHLPGAGEAGRPSGGGEAGRFGLRRRGNETEQR